MDFNNNLLINYGTNWIPKGSTTGISVYPCAYTTDATTVLVHVGAANEYAFSMNKQELTQFTCAANKSYSGGDLAQTYISIGF